MVKTLNKKGNIILDTLTILVVILAFGIITVYSNQIFGDVNTDIQASDTMSNESKAQVQALYTRFPDVMDGLFVFMFILLWAVALLMSYLIDSHPVFFILSIVLLVFVIFIGGILANTYEDVISEDSISAYAAEFPMMNYIITHIIEFTVAIAFSIGVVLYGKYRNL